MVGALKSTSLLEQARSYALSAAGVRELAATMGAAPPWAAIQTAIAERDQTTVQLLLFAASVAGFRPSTALMREAVPIVEDEELITPLIGETTGDQLELIEALLRDDRVAPLVGNNLCGVAVLALNGRPPSPSLMEALRVWTRAHLGADDDGILAEVATRLGDPALLTLVQTRDRGTPNVGGTLLEWIRSEWLARPIAVLEDREAFDPMPLSSTKVGRNDLCPCGSGKKYKKCCADKGPIAAIPLRPMLPRGAISNEAFDSLSDFELLRVSFDTLNLRQLMVAYESFAHRRWWHDAHEIIRAGERCGTLPPSDVRLLQHSLVREALETGNHEVARQAAAHLSAEERAGEIQLQFELFQPSSVLDEIEALALSGLKAEDADRPPEALHSLAFALLDHRPALGVLVARAAIAPNRVFDSEVLLNDIVKARDRLGLPLFDRAEDIFDLFASGTPVVESPTGSPPAEAEAIKAQLAAAASRARALEAELDQHRQALEAARARPTTTPAVDSAEVQHLRQKVAELKGLVNEHATERGRLRAEVKTLTQSRPAPEAPAPAPIEPASEPEAAADAPERRRILTPIYGDAADAALRTVPRHVATAALALSASLAAGDEAAWANTKPLVEVPGLRSARVGIHHRLLFRVDASRARLELVELCARGELEKVLKRLK